MKSLQDTKKLLTPWGEQIDDQPLQEYPRPQFARDSYYNLNGIWEYAITDVDHMPETFDGDIRVPFPPESILSGVEKLVEPTDYLWYKKRFTLPEGFCKAKTFLHFDAVDQACTVTLNGKDIGSHTGGYLPFSFDVTDALEEENELVVRVRDLSNTSYHSRGKQKLARGGIWYTPHSGIWQTVWMESVPETYINDFTITPLYDEAAVKISVDIQSVPVSVKILASHSEDHDAEIPVIAEGTCVGGEITLSLPNFTPWSPENPHLYGLKLSVGEDVVYSYFGMRKFEIRKGKDHISRIYLNNDPIFLHGLLDQGYWPDGIVTPPSDEAMRFDIVRMKEHKFNLLRKHIKIEPRRWYYHCDKEGMVVWQDMVNGGGEYKIVRVAAFALLGIHHRDINYPPCGRENEAGRLEYYEELNETVQLLKNVPSLMTWVPFNEGWGQFDAVEAYKRIHALDPTRLIDHASGWLDQRCGDFWSRHIYFTKIKMKRDKRAHALTEYGGYSWVVPEHVSTDRQTGYKIYKTQDELNEAYETLLLEELLPEVKKGICVTIYTQVTDVEDEVNGILTYDRKIIKIREDVAIKTAEALTEAFLNNVK